MTTNESLYASTFHDNVPPHARRRQPHNFAAYENGLAANRINKCQQTMAKLLNVPCPPPIQQQSAGGGGGNNSPQSQHLHMNDMMQSTRSPTSSSLQLPLGLTHTPRASITSNNDISFGNTFSSGGAAMPFSGLGSTTSAPNVSFGGSTAFNNTCMGATPNNNTNTNANANNNSTPQLPRVCLALSGGANRALISSTAFLDVMATPIAELRRLQAQKKAAAAAAASGDGSGGRSPSTNNPNHSAHSVGSGRSGSAPPLPPSAAAAGTGAGGSTPEGVHLMSGELPPFTPPQLPAKHNSQSSRSGAQLPHGRSSSSSRRAQLEKETKMLDVVTHIFGVSGGSWIALLANARRSRRNFFHYDRTLESGAAAGAGNTTAGGASASGTGVDVSSGTSTATTSPATGVLTRNRRTSTQHQTMPANALAAARRRSSMTSRDRDFGNVSTTSMNFSYTAALGGIASSSSNSNAVVLGSPNSNLTPSSPNGPTSNTTAAIVQVNPWLYGPRHSFDRARHVYAALKVVLSEKLAAQSLGEHAASGSFQLATTALKCGDGTRVENYGRFLARQLLGQIVEDGAAKSVQQHHPLLSARGGGSSDPLNESRSVYYTGATSAYDNYKIKLSDLQPLIANGDFPFVVASAIGNKEPILPSDSAAVRAAKERNMHNKFDWIEICPFFIRSPTALHFTEEVDDSAVYFTQGKEHEDVPNARRNDLRLHHVLGALGSAFAADSSAIANMLPGGSLARAGFVAASNLLLNRRSDDPEDVVLPVMEGCLTTLSFGSHPKAITTSIRDAGIDINIAFPLLFPKHANREFDIIVALDASANTTGACELYIAIKQGFVSLEAELDLETGEFLPLPTEVMRVGGSVAEAKVKIPHFDFGKDVYHKIYVTTEGTLIIYVLGLRARSSIRYVVHDYEIDEDVETIHRTTSHVPLVLLRCMEYLMESKEKLARERAELSGGALTSSSQASPIFAQQSLHGNRSLSAHPSLGSPSPVSLDLSLGRRSALNQQGPPSGVVTPALSYGLAGGHISPCLTTPTANLLRPPTPPPIVGLNSVVAANILSCGGSVDLRNTHDSNAASGRAGVFGLGSGVGGGSGGFASTDRLTPSPANNNFVSILRNRASSVSNSNVGLLSLQEISDPHLFVAVSDGFSSPTTKHGMPSGSPFGPPSSNSPTFTTTSPPSASNNGPGGVSFDHPSSLGSSSPATTNASPLSPLRPILSSASAVVSSVVSESLVTAQLFCEKRLLGRDDAHRKAAMAQQKSSAPVATRMKLTLVPNALATAEAKKRKQNTNNSNRTRKLRGGSFDPHTHRQSASLRDGGGSASTAAFSHSIHGAGGSVGAAGADGSGNDGHHNLSIAQRFLSIEEAMFADIFGSVYCKDKTQLVRIIDSIQTILEEESVALLTAASEDLSAANDGGYDPYHITSNSNLTTIITRRALKRLREVNKRLSSMTPISTYLFEKLLEHGVLKRLDNNNSSSAAPSQALSVAAHELSNASLYFAQEFVDFYAALVLCRELMVTADNNSAVQKDAYTSFLYNRHRSIILSSVVGPSMSVSSSDVVPTLEEFTARLNGTKSVTPPPGASPTHSTSTSPAAKHAGKKDHHHNSHHHHHHHHLHSHVASATPTSTAVVVTSPRNKSPTAAASSPPPSSALTLATMMAKLRIFNKPRGNLPLMIASLVKHVAFIGAAPPVSSLTASSSKVSPRRGGGHHHNGFSSISSPTSPGGSETQRIGFGFFNTSPTMKQQQNNTNNNEGGKQSNNKLHHHQPFSKAELADLAWNSTDFIVQQYLAQVASFDQMSNSMRSQIVAAFRPRAVAAAQSTKASDLELMVMGMARNLCEFFCELLILVRPPPPKATTSTPPTAAAPPRRRNTVITIIGEVAADISTAPLISPAPVIEEAPSPTTSAADAPFSNSTNNSPTATNNTSAANTADPLNSAMSLSYWESLVLTCFTEALEAIYLAVGAPINGGISNAGNHQRDTHSASLVSPQKHMLLLAEAVAGSSHVASYMLLRVMCDYSVEESYHHHDDDTPPPSRVASFRHMPNGAFGGGGLCDDGEGSGDGIGGMPQGSSSSFVVTSPMMRKKSGHSLGGGFNPVKCGRVASFRRHRSIADLSASTATLVGSPSSPSNVGGGGGGGGSLGNTATFSVTAIESEEEVSNESDNSGSDLSSTADEESRSHKRHLRAAAGASSYGKFGVLPDFKPASPKNGSSGILIASKYSPAQQNVAVPPSSSFRGVGAIGGGRRGGKPLPKKERQDLFARQPDRPAAATCRKQPAMGRASRSNSIASTSAPFSMDQTMLGTMIYSDDDEDEDNGGGGTDAPKAGADPDPDMPPGVRHSYSLSAMGSRTNSFGPNSQYYFDPHHHNDNHEDDYYDHHGDDDNYHDDHLSDYSDGSACILRRLVGPNGDYFQSNAEGFLRITAALYSTVSTSAGMGLEKLNLAVALLTSLSPQFRLTLPIAVSHGFPCAIAYFLADAFREVDEAKTIEDLQIIVTESTHGAMEVPYFPPPHPASSIMCISGAGGGAAKSEVIGGDPDDPYGIVHLNSNGRQFRSSNNNNQHQNHHDRSRRRSSSYFRSASAASSYNASTTSESMRPPTVENQIAVKDTLARYALLAISNITHHTANASPYGLTAQVPYISLNKGCFYYQSLYAVFDVFAVSLTPLLAPAVANQRSLALLDEVLLSHHQNDRKHFNFLHSIVQAIKVNFAAAEQLMQQQQGIANNGTNNNNGGSHTDANRSTVGNQSTNTARHKSVTVSGGSSAPHHSSGTSPTLSGAGGGGLGAARRNGTAPPTIPSLPSIVPPLKAFPNFNDQLNHQQSSSNNTNNNNGFASFGGGPTATATPSSAMDALRMLSPRGGDPFNSSITVFNGSYNTLNFMSTFMADTHASNPPLPKFSTMSSDGEESNTNKTDSSWGGGGGGGGAFGSSGGSSSQKKANSEAACRRYYDSTIGALSTLLHGNVPSTTTNGFGRTPMTAANGSSGGFFTSGFGGSSSSFPVAPSAASSGNSLLLLLTIPLHQMKSQDQLTTVLGMAKLYRDVIRIHLEWRRPLPPTAANNASAHHSPTQPMSSPRGGRMASPRGGPRSNGPTSPRTMVRGSNSNNAAHITAQLQLQQRQQLAAAQQQKQQQPVLQPTHETLAKIALHNEHCTFTLFHAQSMKEAAPRQNSKLWELVYSLLSTVVNALQGNFKLMLMGLFVLFVLRMRLRVMNGLQRLSITVGPK